MIMENEMSDGEQLDKSRECVRCKGLEEFGWICPACHEQLTSFWARAEAESGCLANNKKNRRYKIRSVGIAYSVDIEIYASVSNRDFNDGDDRILFSDVGSLLFEGLKLNTAKADPAGPAKRKAEREQFVSAFKKAGLNPVYVEEMPNQYCSDPCCLNTPWFQITSEIGHIVIGWRKSVVEIRIDKTCLPQDTRKMFPGEDTTREDGYIHAWGMKKVVEYLSVLKRQVGCV